ncbi:hypothetical protein RI543_001924 [Arxiozyma heterogenica]|uniref:FCP1 homology domain-containing protein n=1 Tax=Arxiozyma heterogenica TaxID=278026 RepID=A0AAN7W455_9SACH|nr:hypothetical protein RI543_001924 [Kazachstania heterogenica]
MNTLSYFSQYIFNPFSNKEDPPQKNGFEDKHNEPLHTQDPLENVDNIDFDSLVPLTVDIKSSDIETLEDTDSLNITENTEQNNEEKTASNMKLNVSHDKETLSNIQYGFKRILMSIIFFLPCYLIYKPFCFMWRVITLPISFVERGIKLRTRSRLKFSNTKKSNSISSKSSTLESIGETPEEDLSSGEEFYLQRDTVKGSLFRASTIKRDNSKLKQGKSLVNSDGASHVSTTTLGTKKMGRFLFPKKLIPRSILYSKKKKTLVIDLDETLIHSISRGTTHNNPSQAHIVEVKFSTSGVSTLYYVYKRPYCDQFLNKISKWYDIIIFTASMREYADPVIDWLESSFPGKFIKRLYRNDCTLRDGVGYIKDLSIIYGGGKNSVSADRLNEIIIIDNSPISYAMQVDNAIQVEGWISDPTDADLLNLIPLLEALRYTTDVRNILALKSGEKAFHIE